MFLYLFFFFRLFFWRGFEGFFVVLFFFRKLVLEKNNLPPKLLNNMKSFPFKNKRNSFSGWSHEFSILLCEQVVWWWVYMHCTYMYVLTNVWFNISELMIDHSNEYAKPNEREREREKKITFAANCIENFHTKILKTEKLFLGGLF